MLHAAPRAHRHAAATSRCRVVGSIRHLHARCISLHHRFLLQCGRQASREVRRRESENGISNSRGADGLSSGRNSAQDLNNLLTSGFEQSTNLSSMMIKNSAHLPGAHCHVPIGLHRNHAIRHAAAAARALVHHACRRGRQAGQAGRAGRSKAGEVRAGQRCTAAAVWQ